MRAALRPLVLTACLLGAGCGGGGDDGPAPGAGGDPQPTPGVREPGFDLSVRRVRETRRIDGDFGNVETPTPGMKFLVFDVTVTSVGGASDEVNPLSFFVVAGGFTYDDTSATHDLPGDDDCSLDPVRPDGAARCQVVVEVGEAVTSGRLVYDARVAEVNGETVLVEETSAEFRL